jgi:hypothetical protein
VTAETIAARLGVVFLSLNKFYVDEIYNLLFVQLLNLLVGICGLRSHRFDLVRLRSIPRALADVLKPLQNGLLSSTLAMVIGTRCLSVSVFSANSGAFETEMLPEDLVRPLLPILLIADRRRSC